MSIVGKPLNSYQRYINACLRCFQACHECTVLCLQEPDVTQRMNHIGMMSECAGFYQETARLVIMNAKHAKEMCQLCAAVYEECAAGCAQFKSEHCQQCADEYHKCAAGCKAMRMMNR